MKKRVLKPLASLTLLLVCIITLATTIDMGRNPSNAEIQSELEDDDYRY